MVLIQQKAVLWYIHTEQLVATTSGRYLWLKNNVRPLERHKWLDQWPSSTEDKMHLFCIYMSNQSGEWKSAASQVWWKVSRLHSINGKNGSLEAWKGEWTCLLIRNLEVWSERGHGQMDFHLTQVMSCNGAFNVYLFRMKLEESPKCANSIPGKQCGVCGANLACVHRHTPYLHRTPNMFSSKFLSCAPYIYTPYKHNRSNNDSIEC